MEDALISQRMAKADELRTRGENPYANDFKVTDTAKALHEAHEHHDAAALEASQTVASIGGRVMAIRTFGKIVFLSIADRSGRFQANLFGDTLPPEDFARVELLDVGDIVGVTGTVMRTRRGELSLRATSLRILTKSLRPLPDKWHGLSDISTRYRQRYVDLIVNDDVKEAFRLRSLVVRYVRNFLDSRDFLEVETPMLQVLYGGANATPFKTHHRALDLPLYLRIAPELNLKRLVVGGLHRVYELNRCFRNEGVSTRHNPEFTLLEFYQAFATFEDLITLTEELLAGLCQHLLGGDTAAYGEHTLSFARPFNRLTVREGLVRYAGVAPDKVEDREALLEAAKRLNLPKAEKHDLGHLMMEVFEAAAEEHLIQPTFVTEFPIEVSPLSRRNDLEPRFVDRFELYVAGRELCNAFSELNDPIDQEERFKSQVEQRAAGNDEAHPMDEDYIRALEYGLPPTAGEGIGIDRLTMLFTNSQSIRDVILFPLLRPEG